MPFNAFNYIFAQEALQRSKVVSQDEIDRTSVLAAIIPGIAGLALPLIVESNASDDQKPTDPPPPSGNTTISGGNATIEGGTIRVIGGTVSTYTPPATPPAGTAPLENRVTALEAEVKAVNNKVDLVDIKVTNLSTKVDDLSTKVQSSLNAINGDDGLVATIRNLTSQLQIMEANIQTLMSSKPSKS